MQPDQFLEQNFTFVKPNNMTDEECSPLTVYRGPSPDGSGAPVVISKWVEPATGQAVYVTVYGAGIPPMYIGVENPFDENKIKAIQQIQYIEAHYLEGITFNDLQNIWCGEVWNGKRHFDFSQNTYPAMSGKTFFINHFIKPWNIVFKTDQITYNGE